MNEVSKSLEGVDWGYGPEYSPEKPAPEQQNATIENAQMLVHTTMAEIRQNIPGLSEEQYGEIQRSLYHEAEAFLQSSQDVYGEPEKVKEDEVANAFETGLATTDEPGSPSPNPYESHFK
jgi:hypothetical protein